MSASLRLSAAAIVIPSILAAQRSVPPVARDSTALDAVVVTATRVPIASSFASVTVLQGADLRARGITRLADALREVPGAAIVQSGSFGGATSLFLRGGQSNYTKVLIDGVPANLPGGAYDFAFLSTDNVERVEIVRGPASVLYGSDAVSGVIQVFTRGGRGSPRANASLRGGTYGTLDGDLGVSGGAGRASYSFDVAHHASDGLLPENNTFRNTVASAAVRVQRGAHSDGRVTARYSDGAFHYPTSGSGFVVPFQQARREDRRLAVGLDAGHFFAPRIEGRIALANNDVAARSIDEPSAAADTSRFYSVSRTSDARRSAEARLNGFVGARDVVTAGLELSTQSEVARGTSQFQRFAPSATSFDERRRNTAVFAQWLGRTASALSYTLGGRLDDNERFGTFGTYRAAAGWTIADETTLRAAVGSSFKEPLFSEQFTTSFTVGSPDLRPERATSWEAGVERAFAARRLTLAATYFDQRFRDLVQYRATPRGSPAGPNYFNVARASASGLELEARLPELSGTALHADYTYLRTRVTDAGFGASGTFVAGARLLRRPTHSGGVTASRSFIGRASTAFTVRYVGERDDRDFASFPATPVVLGGYATVDLSADARITDRVGGRRAVSLTLRAENLLDRGYEAVKRFSAPGRTILVGARLGTP